MFRVAPTTLRTLLRTSTRGGAVVEFALILPFLALLMVILFDAGFAFWQLMQVEAAAEAGVQYYAAHPTDMAGFMTAVSSAAGTSDISATYNRVCGCPGNSPFEVPNCTTTCDNGYPPGNYAKVSVERRYSPVLPYPGAPDTLTGHAYRRLN